MKLVECTSQVCDGVFKECEWFEGFRHRRDQDGGGETKKGAEELEESRGRHPRQGGTKDGPG